MKTHNLCRDESGKISRLYHIWEDMKSRCNNHRNRRYESYGGRGISLCKDWEDYKQFHDWAMMSGYKNNLTIDRIDVNGNYHPENCRWATQKQQGNNRRNNVTISYNGVSKTIAQWSEIKGWGYHVIKNRLKRGWSIERTLNTPRHKNSRHAA